MVLLKFFESRGFALALNRKILLCTIALGLSGLFVCLGFWQLTRRAENLAGAQTRLERFAQPPFEWGDGQSLPADTTGILGRKARLSGRWDFEREVIIRSRTSEGRPGIEVLTPLLLGETGRYAVMVLRGWLPAPDGLRANLTSAWPADLEAAEFHVVQVEGVLISSRDGRGGPLIHVPVENKEHIALGGLDLAQIRKHLDYKVSNFVLRASDPEPGTSALKPARTIKTGGGLNLSYALQWFSFAIITLAGTIILLRKERAHEQSKVL